MNHQTEAEKAASAAMGFELVVTLDKRRVGDLLCSAFEGGSNYWYMIEGYVAPDPRSVVQHTGLGEVFRHVDYPLSVGGAVVVSDRKAANKGEVTTTKLDWPKLREGLALMAQKHPRHFGDWLAENDDASTGDVFLQCCVLGDVVYG